MSSEGFDFLLEMFPHVDRTVLFEMYSDIENDDVNTVVESLLEDYSSGGYSCQVPQGIKEEKFLRADSISEEGVGQAEGLWTQPPTTENTSSLTDFDCSSSAFEYKPVDDLPPTVCLDDVENVTSSTDGLESDEQDEGQQLCVMSEFSTFNPESEISVSTVPNKVSPVLLTSVPGCSTETTDSNECTYPDTSGVEACSSEVLECVAVTCKTVPCAASHESAFDVNEINDAQNEGELASVLEVIDDAEPASCANASAVLVSKAAIVIIAGNVPSDGSTSSANLSEVTDASLVNGASTSAHVEDFGDQGEELSTDDNPRDQVEEACNLNMHCDESVVLIDDVSEGGESVAETNILPSGQDLDDTISSDSNVGLSAETSDVDVPLESVAAGLCEVNDDFPPELFEVDRDIDDTADDYEIARMISEEDEAASGCNDALEERISLLLNFMPDADPSYLKDICERYSQDEPGLLRFVQEALDDNKYPNFDDYLERQEKVGIIRETLAQITVPMFVNLYSRPFEYFYGSRTKHPSEVAHEFGFLQRRYRNVSDKDLRSVLDKCDHNLTMCCKELDFWDGPTQHMRGDWECQAPQDIDMSFIHEVFFIENERGITEHLELESLQKTILDQARSMEAKLECPICCEDELEIVEMAACAEGHLFCKGCIQKSAETRIGDGLMKFPCLDDSCSAEFGTRTLESLLNPTLFARMVQQRSLEEVASAHIEDLVRCPFCEYAAILPPDLSVLVCENPACMRETCRYCEGPNHIPLRCNEVEKEGETKMRTEIEDRMSDALIRKCNSCGKKFIKSDGCNKMVCLCGAIMCYICRKTVTDYSHFNGMGGSEYHKCPLFTNDNMIHHEEVKTAANRAKAEVTARNPGLELKNDPSKFLPSI